VSGDYSRHIKLYLILLLAFLVVDGIWLSLLAKQFYKDQIGFLLAEDPNWVAVALFYPLFVLAIQVFVVRPGLETGSLKWTLGRAAFFGFITYATYDLTNLATVEGWPVLVTIVDVIWGATLCSLVSFAGYFVAARRNW
jgi:uncharacterized membrane protein